VREGEVNDNGKKGKKMASYSKMIEIASEHMNADYGFDYIGVRAQEEPATVGETMSHKSLVWVDGEETDEELNGVSAIKLNLCKPQRDLYGYPGNWILVLGSNGIEYGEDEGEIIMEKPVVLAVYEVE